MARASSEEGDVPGFTDTLASGCACGFLGLAHGFLSVATCGYVWPHSYPSVINVRIKTGSNTYILRRAQRKLSGFISPGLE